MSYKVKDEKGQTLKRGENEVFGSDIMNVVKGIDVEKRTMTMIGSTEDADRDGDIINVKGWQLENYLKNPVFLWGHIYSGAPIGAATKVIRRRSPNRLEFHLRFPTLGIHPFADMILELFNERIMNASSVGFIPKEWEKIDEEDDSWFSPKRFIKQELLELSAVSVPANPYAVQNAMNMAKNYENGDKLISYITGLEIPNIENPDALNEIKEINAKGAKYEEEEDKKNFFVPVEFDDTWDKEEEKPYKNEHACRLKDPDNYDKFARKNCDQKHDDKCIDVIYGIKGDKTEIQALRYKKDVWSESDAKKHCDSRGGKFEAAATESIDLTEDKETDIFENVTKVVINSFSSDGVEYKMVTLEEYNKLIKRLDDLEELVKSKEAATPVHDEPKGDQPNAPDTLDVILSQTPAKQPNKSVREDKRYNNLVNKISELSKQIAKLNG